MRFIYCDKGSILAILKIIKYDVDRVYSTGCEC